MSLFYRSVLLVGALVAGQVLVGAYTVLTNLPDPNAAPPVTVPLEPEPESACHIGLRKCSAEGGAQDKCFWSYHACITGDSI